MRHGSWRNWEAWEEKGKSWKRKECKKFEKRKNMELESLEKKVESREAYSKGTEINP